MALWGALAGQAGITGKSQARKQWTVFLRWPLECTHTQKRRERRRVTEWERRG